MSFNTSITVHQHTLDMGQKRLPMEQNALILRYSLDPLTVPTLYIYFKIQ